MSSKDQARGGRIIAGAIALILIAGAGVAVAQIARDDDPAPSAVPSLSPTPSAPPDETPPRLSVEKPRRPVMAGKPFRLVGAARGARRIEVNGRRVPLKQGRFHLDFPNGPAGRLRVVATDAAGNEATKVLRPAIHELSPLIRAVHVSAYGWSSRRLRRPLLKMIEQGQINAIELDIKDESGVIGYDSKIPLARRIHSDAGIYDLREVIDFLHRKNVRVIGRLVAFRDPILARAAWRRGHRDWVIQTPNGQAYADYGGFTNFAHPAVRKYNIDIAEEAARAGMDDILYDYVRRPDGPIKTMVFKGLKQSPERSIAGFVAETERRLRPYGARLGASVFGIAATRPKEIAQDIARIARAADYISPMLYPSHWASGEYNVSEPNSHPYKIVYRSLKDFDKEIKGDARIVPWIQDFSLGVHYGPAMVRAQLKAARHRGIKEWLLWDPSVTYTSAALKRHGKGRD